MTNIQNGAEAFKSLIRNLGEAANGDLANRPDEAAAGDVRDYRHLAEMVQLSIEHNLRYGEAGHRQGFARALTDLLVMVCDGVTPAKDWDPIRATQVAFDGPIAA